MTKLIIKFEKKENKENLTYPIAAIIFEELSEKSIIMIFDQSKTKKPFSELLQFPQFHKGWRGEIALEKYPLLETIMGKIWFEGDQPFSIHIQYKSYFFYNVILHKKPLIGKSTHYPHAIKYEFMANKMISGEFK